MVLVVTTMPLESFVVQAKEGTAVTVLSGPPQPHLLYPFVAVAALVVTSHCRERVYQWRQQEAPGADACHQEAEDLPPVPVRPAVGEAEEPAIGASCLSKQGQSVLAVELEVVAAAKIP